MSDFQVLVLAAGPNTFQGTFAKSKLQFEVNDGVTLLERSLREFLKADSVICAVNPEDFIFAKEIASKYANVQIICMNRNTRGALITLASCLGSLNQNQPLLVAPVDGIVPDSINSFVERMVNGLFDGGAMTMNSNSPHMSYVLSVKETPIEFVEKSVVSNRATTGFFYFKNIDVLQDSIEWVLLSKSEINGQYYISSALNRLIYDNRLIGIYDVKPESYFRFSNPEEALDSRTRMGEY